jgi:DNA polymerase III subunit gamma/tau
MALALYRKYRPKTLDDLVGQEQNVQILKNAARAGRIGHAYLFYGPRGTGKTSTARLIAKLLNCEAMTKGGEPCNKCQSCTEIDTNSSLDVVEIDAASNRGIDEIRNLKEHIATAPASSKHKVYIIDEAHMLTGAAFNALLKTLEEPPAHAVFVLATTEYDKLPPTITSRTQRFIFRKGSKVNIAKKLREISDAEGISIDDDAIDLIAAAAEGSFRDAESLLDQISSDRRKIDVKTAEALTGRVGLARVHSLAEYIVARDLKGALSYLATLNEEGCNFPQITRDLIHYLRKAITLKLNATMRTAFETELSRDELEALAALAEKINPDYALPLLKALIRGYSEMRYSPFAMIPLEVALIENLKS